jgi:hypothetical protein
MSKLKSDIRRNKDHSTTNERLKVLLARSKSTGQVQADI